jgi:transcriptional regulator with XRE-family HTH domain
MPIRVHFGAKVRSVRKSQNISQEELAHIAGINRSHMGQIERGTQSAGLTTIARIAKALDCSAAHLLELPPFCTKNVQVRTYKDACDD